MTDSNVIWKSLEEQYDLQIVSTLFHTVGNVISLQYSPENPLMNHLTTFTDLWNTVVEQCSKAKEIDIDNFAWHLKIMTSTLMSKRNLLTQTFKHKSLSNVVENIITKEAITYPKSITNSWPSPWPGKIHNLVLKGSTFVPSKKHNHQASPQQEIIPASEATAKVERISTKVPMRRSSIGRKLPEWTQGERVSTSPKS